VFLVKSTYRLLARVLILEEMWRDIERKIVNMEKTDYVEDSSLFLEVNS